MNSFLDNLKTSFQNGSILTKLLFINVGVFILVFVLTLFFPGILAYIIVPGSFEFLIRRPWTILSYMFVHEGVWHLIMNMLWLWWFGKLFLLFFNEKQLTAVYLLGGFVGALFHIGINFLLPEHRAASVLGASAAVMSVVFAVVAYKPDYEIPLIFIGSVKIKYLGIFAFALDIIGLLSNLKSGVAVAGGVAHIAHIGGALLGLWFGYQMKNGKDITRLFNNFLNNFFALFSSGSKTSTKNKRKKGRTKAKTDWEYNAEKKSKEKETDRILEKIKKSGYDSLSKKEKDFLFRQSKK